MWLRFCRCLEGTYLALTRHCNLHFVSLMHPIYTTANTRMNCLDIHEQGNSKSQAHNPPRLSGKQPTDDVTSGYYLAGWQMASAWVYALYSITVDSCAVKMIVHPKKFIAN